MAGPEQPPPTLGELMRAVVDDHAAACAASGEDPAVRAALWGVLAQRLAAAARLAAQQRNQVRATGTPPATRGFGPASVR